MGEKGSSSCQRGSQSLRRASPSMEKASVVAYSGTEGPPAPGSPRLCEEAEQAFEMLCTPARVLQAIAKLPLFTWDEAKQQQQEQSVCSVCTEVLQVGDQVQSLPCHETHLFHPACLRPWLSKSNACPVCREVREGFSTVFKE
eukprot:1160092-Pelagomonas_calceolata.AAC.8